jgi:hypothetical protein
MRVVRLLEALRYCVEVARGCCVVVVRCGDVLMGVGVSFGCGIVVSRWGRSCGALDFIIENHVFCTYLSLVKFQAC